MKKTKANPSAAAVRQSNCSAFVPPYHKKMIAAAEARKAAEAARVASARMDEAMREAATEEARRDIAAAAYPVRAAYHRAVERLNRAETAAEAAPAFVLKKSNGENGRTFLEVINPQALPGLVVSCCVESWQTEAEAVTELFTEFLHPFGAAWESAEQYGNELSGVRWLAGLYGIKETDCK